jgi:PAS domain S-box-containing protein
LIQELDSLRREIEKQKKSKSEWENERDGLKKSEARFRSYFNLPLYGIAITSPEKGWIEVNDKICSIMGYSRDEIVRMTWTEMTHPDDLAADLEQFKRVLTGQTDHYHMKKRFIRKDGNVICTNLSVGCVRKPDGSVDHIVAVVEDITSLQQAKKELQASEEKYHSLFDKSIDAILLTTPDGRILAANPEACRIFQRSEEEICRIGRAGLMDLTDPRLTAALEERVRTGKFHGELTFISKDGTSFPGKVSSVIFRDHDGQLKTSMIIRDMSEKKKREQDYQLLFREMLNGFAVHEIICDTQGDPVNYRFLAVNPAFERITGLKAEHVVGRTVLEVLPDTERYWIETYGRVALTGEPTLFENYSKVLDKYFVVTAFRSAPNQFACNFTDITDRKRVEEALRESEEKYRILFENAGEAIFVAQDGKLVFVNPMTATIMGYSNEELASRPFVNFIHQDDRDFVMDRYVRRLKGENIPRRYFFRVLHKDGGFRWVDLDVVLINWQGKPATLNFMTNITERKQAEEKEKERQTLLRMAGEKAKLGGWIVNLEDNRVTWSDEVAAIHETPAGYSPLVEQGISFYTPEWKERITEVFTDCAQKGISYDEEMEIITAGGKRIWVRTIGEAVKNDAGKILKVQGAFQDITERKQTEKNLQDTLESLRKSFATTIQVMVAAVESRDPYTAGHQIRSADLARAIATEMGLPKEKIDGIRMAGSIHDIGKLSIPSEILTKPTKLTSLEFSLIKEHPQKGFELLKDVESPWPLAQIVYQHHERMDGSGYPRQLKGEEIILEARILAVADVVEAMSSHRPYRPSLGLNPALAEIEKNRGTLYDAEAVDACLRLFREKGFQLEGAGL